jgi:hypothetical protein
MLTYADVCQVNGKLATSERMLSHLNRYLAKIDAELQVVQEMPRMITYARVCSRMLTYAHVCSRMLTDADVCSRMLTYAHVC